MKDAFARKKRNYWISPRTYNYYEFDLAGGGALNGCRKAAKEFDGALPVEKDKVAEGGYFTVRHVGEKYEVTEDKNGSK